MHFDDHLEHVNISVTKKSFRPLSTESADVTSTYSLDILYSGSGIMRRSVMNIYGACDGAVLHGLQVKKIKKQEARTTFMILLQVKWENT